MRFRRLVVLGSAALGAAGCAERDLPPEVSGTPIMPAEFGKLDSSAPSCPDLGGLYAWPWVQGQPFGYQTSTQPEKYGSFLDIPLHEEAQIWIKGPVELTGMLVLRSRMVNRDPTMSIRSLTEEWSYREHSRNEYGCKGGWLDIAERPVQGERAGQFFGGTGAVVGVRIGKLLDGSLVVGQRLRVFGRTRPGGWTSRKGSTRPAPDRVQWYWTRLARVGPTGDVPAKDAGPPDTRVTMELPAGLSADSAAALSR